MMEPIPDETLERIRAVRDRLSQELFNHPDVSLIDIGIDPEPGSSPAGLVVRVHVRKPDARETLFLPPEVDGVIIRILTGDYHLE